MAADMAGSLRRCPPWGYRPIAVVQGYPLATMRRKLRVLETALDPLRAHRVLRLQERPAVFVVIGGEAAAILLRITPQAQVFMVEGMPTKLRRPSGIDPLGPARNA